MTDDHYNNNGNQQEDKCPDGYINDLWFIPVNNAEIELKEYFFSFVGSNKCTLPIKNMEILFYILTIQYSILLLFLIARIYLERNGNRTIRHIFVFSAILAMLHLILLQTIGKFGYTMTFPLLGVIFFFFHIITFLAGYQNIKAIPAMFENKFSLRNLEILGKNQMIKISTFFCITGALLVLIFWSVLIPLQHRIDRFVIYYKIGCFGILLAEFTQSIIGWKSLGLLIQLIEGASSCANRNGNSSNNSQLQSRPQNNNPSQNSMDKLKRKFKTFQFYSLIVGMVMSPTIFILHMLMFPMYFSVATYHIIGMFGVFPPMFIMFPAKVNSNNKVTSPSSLTNSTLNKKVMKESVATVYQE